MTVQATLVPPEYCMDSCVFLDFWNVDDPQRKYGMDGFAGHWRYLEGQIAEGKIIAPISVREELLKGTNQGLHAWLKAHDFMFVEMDSDSLAWLGKITQKYQAYTKSAFGREPTDAIIIATAKANGLTVLTSEQFRPTHNPEDPKIPNVCADTDFEVPYVNIREYFANANVTYEITPQS